MVKIKAKDNGKVTKSMQVLLVVMHYVLTVGKGEKVQFTCGNINDRYGKNFVDWETKSSSIHKLLTSAFDQLIEKKYLKVVGQYGKENLYEVNSENYADSFHELMEGQKVMYEDNEEFGKIILSDDLQKLLISYSSDGIFEEEEGHYISLEGKEFMEFMRSFSK